jgi:hypothetical protein
MGHGFGAAERDPVHKASGALAEGRHVAPSRRVGLGGLDKAEHPPGFDDGRQLAWMHAPAAPFIAGAKAQTGAPSRHRVRGDAGETGSLAES